jgi:hypothetical protein
MQLRYLHPTIKNAVVRAPEYSFHLLLDIQGCLKFRFTLVWRTRGAIIPNQVRGAHLLYFISLIKNIAVVKSARDSHKFYYDEKDTTKRLKNSY